MSLRGTLSLAAAGFLVLALGASIGMVEVSTLQHQAAAGLARSFEKVTLSGELQVDLLLAQRASTPAERATLDQELQSKLDALGTSVASPEGHRLAGVVQRSIARYLHAGSPDWRDAGRGGHEDLREARRALDRLVAIGEGQVSAALGASARWDRLSDLVGWSIASVLVAGVAAVLVWLWFSAFRPLLAIAGTMRRFAGGDRRARVPERGQSEARNLARGFNEMVRALLEQQDRRVAFVAGIAHDLRNPLSAIQLAAASLERTPPSPEEQRRKLELIRRQTGRLERMLGDFLDRSRIEAGQLELKRELCDLRELSRTSVELFEGVSEAHPIALHRPDRPVVVGCDHGRIEQVLNNLLSNAIKYSPGGGAVTVTLESRGPWAVVAVTDHGVGLSEIDRRALFQPYRRLGREREKIAGVGLGLFVSRRIVEAHGGEITVESAPEKGSTFRVKLPLAQPTPRPDSTRDAS